ncbi:hypothetical protein SEA_PENGUINLOVER67_59 [Mycobacterium phage PenguinLover67]|nr:hypothetical protein SEA_PENGUINLOVER67_59 [Mycobacterium phage PenguinLover67]
MDWTTALGLAGWLAIYLIGRAVGRSQGRAEASRPVIKLNLLLEGDPIGGIAIADLQPAERIIPPGPPPGHPEATD